MNEGGRGGTYDCVQRLGRFQLPDDLVADAGLHQVDVGDPLHVRVKAFGSAAGASGSVDGRVGFSRVELSEGGSEAAGCSDYEDSLGHGRKVPCWKLEVPCWELEAGEVPPQDCN